MRIKQYCAACTLLLVCWFSLIMDAAQAQNKSILSISEMHQLAETMVNYAPDSSLILLDLAAKKIKLVENKELATLYWAENNLQRADYWIFDDPLKAKVYVEKALTYYRENTDNKRLAEIYCIKAQVIKIKGHDQPEALQNSLPYFDTALTYALKQDAPATKAFVYYENAITYQQADRWQESLESAFLAKHYAQESEDSLSMAMAFVLMGRTYNHFGFSDKSQDNISKAISYGKGIFLISTVIHTYANILLKNNKFQLALENYKLALEMNLAQNRLDNLISVYTSIGQLQLFLGQLQEAEETFLTLTELKKNHPIEEPKTILFFSQMHNHLGDNKMALAELDDFKKMYSQATFNAFDIDLNKGAADLYYTLGKPNEAAILYKKWGLLKDSLQTFTNRLQLSELEKMYFNERTKNEEITLKNEELKESRASQATMGLLLFGFLLVGGSITFFIRLKGLKENQKLKDALKNKQLEQLMEGQETERQRLARELHDGIGQSLAALKILLQFDEHHNSSHPAVIRVDEICEEVRSLSHQMMPLELKENGLKAAIIQLLENSFTNSDIQADLVTHGVDERLPDLVEIHLYRISQELISNILKHAHATEVGVQLLKRNSMISLVVEDNGKGFNEEIKNQGIGMNNIYARIEAISGTINIQSSEKEGTFVRISIPFSEQFNRKTA